MNILFVFNTPGGDKEENRIALIPADKVKDLDLDTINDKMVNGDELTDEVADQIVKLYKRTGLESQHPDGIPVDLEEHMNPTPPFQVDRVIYVGWAV